MQRRRHTPETDHPQVAEAERLIGQGRTIPEAAKELGIEPSRRITGGVISTGG